MWRDVLYSHREGAHKKHKTTNVKQKKTGQAESHKNIFVPAQVGGGSWTKNDDPRFYWNKTLKMPKHEIFDSVFFASKQGALTFAPPPSWTL